MRVALADLRLGRKRGEGAQGAVFDVEGSWSELTFPSVVCKRFAAGTAVSGPALEVLASLRDDLTAEERSVIDAYTVWPVAVVVDGDRVWGYLMQEIPPQFLQTIQTSSGSDVIPREIQHLFVADAITQRNLGEAPNRLERLALCREMAFALGFLHRRGVVFGDLSYRNAVYALRPRPAVMLLDCDAVRIEGQGAAVQQLNSPGWAAPEKGPQSRSTDRYKLGLFVLRCCTPEVNAQTRDPEKAAGVLDEAGMALLRRALGGAPEARTSGREWVEHLDGVIARAGGLSPRRNPLPSPASPSYRQARPGEPRAATVAAPRPRGSAGGGPLRPSPPGGPAMAGGSRPVSVLHTAPTYVHPGPPQPTAALPAVVARPAPRTAAGTGSGAVAVAGAGAGAGDGWKIVAGLWAVAVLLGVIALIAGASTSSRARPTERAVTPPTRPATTVPRPPGTVAPAPPPPQGATITGPTPCPARDGSSPRATTFAAPPPQCIDPARSYDARVSTSEGELVIALDQSGAPVAVNNFVVLSRYHYYDGVPFHRVVPGFVVQGGDATGRPAGAGGPGYTFPDELPVSADTLRPRTVAMANAGPDTNGSQFFIVLTAGKVSPNHSVLGQVTVGFDSTVAALVAGPSAGEPPPQPAIIKTVTIVER